MISLLLAFSTLSFSYDPNTPHGHNGVLKPITSKPAAVSLSPSDVESLKKGEVLLRSARGDEGGRGVAVQYVNAPSAKVWDTILDYDKYPDRVNNVKSCRVYKTEGNVLSLEMISSITPRYYKRVRSICRNVKYVFNP